MSEFDWVTARNNCTAVSEFKNLASSINSDIKTRIDQDETMKQKIEFIPNGENKFAVRRNGSHEIMFEQSGEAINIVRINQNGTERDLLTVTVSMNEQGGCVLKEGDKELLPWQVRRKALEDTFFKG